MAALRPEFTDSFTVQTDIYGAFILIVRQNVIRYCSDRRPGIIQPVLPPEQTIPKFWFHIVLHTKTSSLTLAIRMDNLYLVGFKTSAGVWREFGKQGDTHLISGAKWLEFGGRYPDLIGEYGDPADVLLGRAQMTKAVDVLAKYDGTSEMILEEQLQGGQDDKYALPKSMLVKLVIMICEGLRFHSVTGTVTTKFDNVTARITEIEGKQVRKWDKISEAVFKWADDPSAKFPELEKIGIKDKNDAARIVALVKYISN